MKTLLIFLMLLAPKSEVSQLSLKLYDDMEFQTAMKFKYLYDQGRWEEAEAYLDERDRVKGHDYRKTLLHLIEIRKYQNRLREQSS